MRSGFCHPTDVEAFTEEKKKILLYKRQGKGADFVRAVDEIIDSYEKSKQWNQDEFNSCDEGNASNADSSEGSKGKCSAESPDQKPVQVQPSKLEMPHISLVKSDSCDAVEIPVASMEAEGLHTEAMSEGLVKIASVHDQTRPISTLNSLRKQSTDGPLQSYFVQKRPPLVQRSRCSSRADLFKTHEPVMPVIAVDAASDVVSDATCEESMANKLVRKSSDTNSVGEDIESEMVVTEYEAVNFNEGGASECNYKTKWPGPVTDFFADGVEMGGRLDLQPKAVVLKKKRKPNRRQGKHGAIAHDNFVKDFEVGFGKNNLKSPIICEKSNVRFQNADGDEHLPLVKRARARMGKPSMDEKQLDDFVDTKETSATATASFGNSYTHPADETSFKVKAVNSLSPSRTPNHKKETAEPQLLETKKHHLKCCSVDGEVDLPPPSKHLHRALAAMSANAAEAVNAYVEAQTNMGILSNGCRSSTRRAPFIFPWITKNICTHLITIHLVMLQWSCP